MARTQLRDSLPQVISAGADTGPLAALLAAADGMHQPVGDVLDHLETWFHPLSAPDPMVAYLASWVDLDWLTLAESPTRARSTLPGGTVPLRDLLGISADLAATRGTVGVSVASTASARLASLRRTPALNSPHQSSSRIVGQTPSIM